MLYSRAGMTAFSTQSLPQRRASLGHMVSQSTVLLMVTIGTLILVLALMILFHQNANATKGYRLRTLERERSQLLLQEEVLKMQLAAEQSLETLGNARKINVMAPAKNVQYTRDMPTLATEPDLSHLNQQEGG